MIHEQLITEDLKSIPFTDSREELLLSITQIYLKLFPVKDAYLFRYSVLDNFAEGILWIEEEHIKSISYIRDNASTIPSIYAALCEKEAKYFDGFDYYLTNSVKYQNNGVSDSLLVVPIISGNLVIAYICSNQVQAESINASLLKSATLFGQISGETITRGISKKEQRILSKREWEVMRQVADGESTKVVAKNLCLSEVTVNQYIKQAITKLGATNRTHAISIMYRKNLLN